MWGYRRHRNNPLCPYNCRISLICEIRRRKIVALVVTWGTMTQHGDLAYTSVVKMPQDEVRGHPEACDGNLEKKQSLETGGVDCKREGQLLEPKEQICFDFTKGQCMRGDSCKYSHDVEYIVQVNSQEKGICFDFLKGTCSRGVLCRFSHDLNNLKPLLNSQATKGEMIGKGKKKAPICYDFVKNKCAKGAECRYSHDYTSLFNQIHRKRSSVPKPDGVMDVKNVQHSQTVCIDYLRGRCTRGEGCRYKHVLGTEAGGQAQSAPAGAHGVQLPVMQGLDVGDANQAMLENLLTSLRLMKLENDMKQASGLDMPSAGMHAVDMPSAGMQGSFMHESHMYGMSYPPADMGQSRYMDMYVTGIERRSQDGLNRAGMLDAAGGANMAAEQHMYMQGQQLGLAGGMGLSASPPITNAEKMSLFARQRLFSSDSDGTDSPTIGAGWTSEHGPHHHEVASTLSRFSPLKSLHQPKCSTTSASGDLDSRAKVSVMV